MCIWIYYYFYYFNFFLKLRRRVNINERNVSLVNFFIFKLFIVFDNYDDFFFLYMDICFIWFILVNRKRYVIRDNCLVE